MCDSIVLQCYALQVGMRQSDTDIGSDIVKKTGLGVRKLGRS